tara:strand:- start:615 stop:1502 length:888 start_codon:yes stop_codon:yes gene_type:complete
MKKFYLVVNPKGGAKKGLEILKKVRPIFENSGAQIDVLETEYAGHAEEYAKTMDYKGYDGFCAIGGDGTMHEVINGMLKREDGQMLPIGLITGGTGNAFMHDLECLDPIESVERIMKGHLRPIDIARVDANGQLFYAFNIIGWGMVTDATSLAEKLRWLGETRYNIGAIYEVIKSKKRISKLIIDNEEIIEDFVFIIACNTIHTGKAMKIAPLAKVDDGKIDIVIVRKASRVQLLKLFPKLFTGEHIDSPLVEYDQIESFSIVPEETSAITIDGELIGQTPINVQLESQKINVLV